MSGAPAQARQSLACTPVTKRSNQEQRAREESRARLVVVLFPSPVHLARRANYCGVAPGCFGVIGVIPRWASSGRVFPPRDCVPLLLSHPTVRAEASTTVSSAARVVNRNM